MRKQLKSGNNVSYDELFTSEVPSLYENRNIVQFRTSNL